MFRKMYYVDGCDLRRHSMDVVASNGVIHAVDCVLFPPSPQPLPSGRTVAQVIVERFELSIFEQALNGGGLLRAVNQASANPLTVFAHQHRVCVLMASSPSFFIDTEAERMVNPGYPGLQRRCCTTSCREAHQRSALDAQRADVADVRRQGVVCGKF